MDWISGQSPPHVLVVKPCCIGDVLLASPLVGSIKSGWPGARVEWAAAPHARAAAAGIPGVEDVVDASGCVPGALSALGLWRLCRRIRRGRYDVIFVPDRSRALAWAVRWAGPAERVGLDSGGRGRSYTVRVPVADTPVRHEAAVYGDLAAAAGLPPPQMRLQFAPTEAERAWAAGALRRLGIEVGERGGRPGLTAVHPGGGVNPGMSLTEKRWPAECFAEVTRRLLAAGDSVLVLGGATDAGPVATLIAAAPGAWDLSAGAADGAATLGQTAALLAASDVFLGNDTGIAHLAAAVGTPAVVVFGPTDPRRYGPLPGTGVAVAPLRSSSSPPPRAGTGEGLADGGGRAEGETSAFERLADARGSRAIEEVTVEAVWAALGD